MRTDAVWEKMKLRDVFRLSTKVQVFDPKTKKYWLYPAEEAYTWLYDKGGILNKRMPWVGYKLSGMTVE